MDKSAVLLLAAALLVTTGATTPLTSPPPVLAVVKEKYPPRPLRLLYTTFQDHAVLQRDKTLPIWGLTVPGATVDVTFAGQNASATADATGHWQVSLPAMKAGGPYTLRAKSSSGQMQTLNDVMLGDVYLCSGQSNMELPLRLATNYDSELKSAQNNNLRLFHVQRFSSAAPHQTFGSDASWAVTTPETAKDFSATCYYFGREVQPAAKIAVGLIEDAWGGAAIQAWISNETLASLGGFAEPLDIAKTYATDRKLADTKWRAMSRAWYEKNEPALKATPAWNDPAFDDSAWNSHEMIGTWRIWNVPQLKTFNGIMWLRKTITLTAAQASGAATLILGPIDSEDLTFINGTELGASHAYDFDRIYPVPAGVLHEGKNVLVMAVESGAGVLWPSEKMSLRTSDGTSVALTGPWRWKTSVTADKIGSAPWMPWYNQFGVSTLYNGMILPLGRTQIAGMVWYQGETDAGHPKEYDRLLRAMIADWRNLFGAETPFYIVQLPGFGPTTTKPIHSDWAEMREVQRKVADTTPNTGLAVTIDLGSPDNIHPQAKQEVGRRLGLLARKFIYGEAITAQSPAPLSATRKGKAVTVHFDHVASGLEAREWPRAVGFSLCEAPDHCSFVDGMVRRDSITLDATKHPKAIAVRFCWADSPLCNLVNSEGLPAVPFEMPITLEKRRSATRQ